jgi:porin
MNKNLKRLSRMRGVARLRIRTALSLLLSASAFSTAFAQTVTSSGPAPEPTGLWDRSSLFGDMAGLRPWLGNYGVTLSLLETSEYLRNLSGGVSREGAYDGLTQATIQVDTAKAFGLPGGTFNVSALQIHGRDLSQHTLLTLQGASGIEADAGTRLWELWYQQSLLNDRLDIKIGQQSLDQEFMVSQYAATFMNLTFGWPVLPSVDLPSGGPVYPLSSLGVRFKAKPSTATTILAGVFDGNPAGSNPGDPQKLNAHGTNFSLHDGALFIAEMQYAINQPPTDSRDPQPVGLPGIYKLGFWYNTQNFADLQHDTNGVSLADPASTGVGAKHRGDYSVYAVADQMVWRASGDSPRSIGVFARVTGAPGDRNLVDLGVNAGVSMKAPFKGRDNDIAGLAVGYARIGSGARALDRDTAAFSTPGYPVRSAETIVEATYLCQLAPWWQVQADLQYAFRPAGGILNPANPSVLVHDEAIVGVRTTVSF